MKTRVRLCCRRAANWSCCHLGRAAESELCRKEPALAFSVHHEQNKIALKQTDLKSEAATFDSYRCGCTPVCAATAGEETLAILPAADERRLLHAGHNHNAMSTRQKIR